ncbi:hypothetical protein ACFLSE_06635 [Bacteroidota bacterium]
MKIELPENTPDNIKRAFNESQRILNEAFEESTTSAKKYKSEVKRRKYLAYFLKIISGICALLITAGWLPHFLAIAVALIFLFDSVFSNSKRLVSIAQAEKAYVTIEKRIIRTHQTGQNKLIAEPDPILMATNITDFNIKLTEEAHNEFKTVETAIDKSDIETLQALSLDEEKLNLAMKHIQGNK